MTLAKPSISLSLGAVIFVGVAAFALNGCNSGNNLTDAEYLAKARELHAKPDDKAAVVEVRNALQKNPKNVEARILLAEIYLGASGGKQAQNELEIAIQRGATAAQVKLPMARAYLLQGNYDGAAKEAAVDLSTLGADRASLMEVEGRARIGMRQFARGCALFESAIAENPKLLDGYYGSATCAAVKGDRDRGRAVLRDAIRIDPAEAKPWILLGDIDRVDHKLDDAEKNYTKALTLKKNNIDALIGRAMVYAEGKKLKEAEADIAVVDTVYKGHPMATYVTGLIRFRQGRMAEAKTAFETTLATAPTHFPSILWLGLTNFVQGNYELAATQLNQYVTLVPNAVKVRALMALARARLGGLKQAKLDLGDLAKYNVDDPETLAMIGETYTFLGNVDASAEFLARAVELGPDSPGVRVDYAATLLGKNDVPGAIAQLKAVMVAHPDSVQASSLMVRALIQAKNYPAAIAQAKALEQLDPKNPMAGDYLGSIQLLQGDRAAAEATFKALLANHPKFFAASNNLALMAVARGDADAARGYYRQALDADPKSLPAMLGLHSVERSQGHAAEAEKVLQQAAQAYPTEVLPAQLLGQSYNAEGMPRKALDVTGQALQAHPSDAGLLEVRGLAYLGVNEPASALITFNKLVQTRGDSADAYLYLASAHTALGDRASAKTALATALKMAPKDYRIRLASARAGLTEGRVDEALATARALERSNANDSDGYVLEAAAYEVDKKPRDAARVLTAALQKFPKDASVRLALAKVQSTLGDTKGQLENLTAWQKLVPADPLPLEALAEVQLRVGDEAAAAEAYRALVLMAPNNVRALNNAAFLLRTRSPQEAIELVERALRIEPNNANALDTLGQIELERSRFAEAVAALKKANELAPANPRIRFHYAVALAKAGQEPLARRELERLLAASAGFEDETKARELLKSLPRS